MRFGRPGRSEISTIAAMMSAAPAIPSAEVRSDSRSKAPAAPKMLSALTITAAWLAGVCRWA